MGLGAPSWVWHCQWGEMPRDRDEIAEKHGYLASVRDLKLLRLVSAAVCEIE